MTDGGRFITLEGAEGVGKSTSLDFIHRYLADRSIDALVTREPGGTPLAEEIRQLVLAPRDETVDAVAETLLIFAARAQHFANVIQPALDNGQWVLCDRFTDSTFAYQGGGHGVAEDFLAALAAQVHGDRWPHLTLYLDAPLEVGVERIATRELDRIEREPQAFFERTRAVFQQRVREQDRIVEIDASQSRRAVRRDIAAALDRFMAAQQ